MAVRGAACTSGGLVINWEFSPKQWEMFLCSSTYLMYLLVSCEFDHLKYGNCCFISLGEIVQHWESKVWPLLRKWLTLKHGSPLQGCLGFAENCQRFLRGEAFLNPRESPPFKFWSEQCGGIMSTSFLAIFSGWTRKYCSCSGSCLQSSAQPASLLTLLESGVPVRVEVVQ